MRRRTHCVGTSRCAATLTGAILAGIKGARTGYAERMYLAVLNEAEPSSAAYGSIYEQYALSLDVAAFSRDA